MANNKKAKVDTSTYTDDISTLSVERKESVNADIFETDNLALAPFLELNGLQYMGRRIGKGKNNNTKVFFQFKDEKKVGLDLEMRFRFSPEKKYRDAIFFYRSQIEQAKKELK